jgi:carbon storage regulator CsrA
MLVLSRRPHERIVFPEIRTTIEVLAAKPGAVRLGIEAPPEVTVLRQEVHDRITDWQLPPARPAAAPDPEPVRQLEHLVRTRLQVTRTGLAELRRHLRAGRTEEAGITLENLEEDLHLLARRLEGNKAAPPRRAAAGRRALLVEDNRNERELLAGFLRLAGIEVDTAGDGCDALDWLHKRGRPDVVLLDMGLPRCDGPTMVRKLRRDPEFADLKIFAVSGHSPEEFNLGSGPTGVDRWFHKPIDPEALIRQLREELADCRQRS